MVTFSLSLSGRGGGGRDKSWYLRSVNGELAEVETFQIYLTLCPSFRAETRKFISAERFLASRLVTVLSGEGVGDLSPRQPNPVPDVSDRKGRAELRAIHFRFVASCLVLQWILW